MLRIPYEWRGARHTQIRRLKLSLWHHSFPSASTMAFSHLSHIACRSSQQKQKDFSCMHLSLVLLAFVGCATAGVHQIPLIKVESVRARMIREGKWVHRLQQKNAARSLGQLLLSSGAPYAQKVSGSFSSSQELSEPECSKCTNWSFFDSRNALFEPYLMLASLLFI